MHGRNKGIGGNYIPSKMSFTFFNFFFCKVAGRCMCRGQANYLASCMLLLLSMIRGTLHFSFW